MSAGAGQGIHRSRGPVQQDRHAARVGLTVFPVGQFGVGQHLRPLVRPLLPRGAVDIHAHDEAQVPSQVGTTQQHPQPGQAQRLAAASSSRARDHGGQVQAQRCGVHRGVHQSDPGLRPVSVGPVVQPGSRGRHGGHHAGSYQQVGGPSAAGPPAASSRADITHAPIGSSVSTGCSGCPGGAAEQVAHHARPTAPASGLATLSSASSRSSRRATCCKMLLKPPG